MQRPRSIAARGAAHLEPTVALLSHRVSSAVPSPKRGLTSEFGMGSGVAPALWTAGKISLPEGRPPPDGEERPPRSSDRSLCSVSAPAE